jgi:S-DNA-T family DNA segregation ATPase FtsK/SpoIIIE
VFTPGVWTIVARSARAMAEAVRSAGIEPVVLGSAGDAEARAAFAAHETGSVRSLVIIGDADAWAAAWALAALVREASTVVAQGGARELRALLTPAGTLPPLIDDPAAQCWVSTVAGPVRRAGWPGRRGN